MATLGSVKNENVKTVTKVEVVTIPKDQPIGLPEGVSLQQLDSAIHARMEYDSKTIAIDAEIDAPFLPEALAAFHAVLTDKYGWTTVVDTPGFFGKQPPVMISVQLGPDKSIQVPWGRFTVPNITDGYLQTDAQPRGGKRGEPFVLHITGEVKRRDEVIVNDIVERVRERVRTQSVYKGTAFSVRLNDENGNPLPMPEPKFKRLDPTVAKTLVLATDVERAVDANLFTPIRFPDAVKRMNGTLKRGILLAGPFGGGKTMVATKTALLAVEHGWTYIEVENIEELAQVLKVARYYQKVIVFCEDLDRVMRGERNISVDEILNTVDGVDSKGVDMVVVFTTNELENIHPAMLRPGRLDAIIPVGPPDAQAVARLLRQYGGDAIPADDPLTLSSEALAGKMPSVIREVVDRSKLYALTIAGGQLDGLRIGDEALLGGVHEMEEHVRLLTPKEPDLRSETVKAADIMAEAVIEASKNGAFILPLAPGKPGIEAFHDDLDAQIRETLGVRGQPESQSRRRKASDSAPATN